MAPDGKWTSQPIPVPIPSVHQPQAAVFNAVETANPVHEVCEPTSNDFLLNYGHIDKKPLASYLHTWIDMVLQ